MKRIEFDPFAGKPRPLVTMGEAIAIDDHVRRFGEPPWWATWNQVLELYPELRDGKS